MTLAMSPILEESRAGAARRPMHVVQVTRDKDLLRLARDSEPVRRQLDYARELDRRVPGSTVTILVLGHRRSSYGWRCDNLRVMPLGTLLQGALRLVPTLRMLHRSAPISVVTTQVPYDEAWLALAFAGWHRIPVIGQIHSDLFAESAAWSSGRSARQVLRDWLARRILPAFSAVRTVSSESRRSIAGIGERISLTTIPVPVPMVSTPARTDSQARKEPVIMFVGRLAHEKDLSHWLKVRRGALQ